MKRAQTRRSEREYTQHLSILPSVAQLESEHAEPLDRPFLLFSSLYLPLSLFLLSDDGEIYVRMTVVGADVYHFFFFSYAYIKKKNIDCKETLLCSIKQSRLDVSFSLD